MSIATFCLECIYSLVEYLTKFATVRMAITGEAFFDAARRATDLLTRNFLKVSALQPHQPSTSCLCFDALPCHHISQAPHACDLMPCCVTTSARHLMPTTFFKHITPAPHDLLVFRLCLLLCRCL